MENETKSYIWLKPFLFLVLALVVIGGSIFIGTLIGKNQITSRQSIVIQPTSPTALPTRIDSIINPTANWKTYNSPVIGDFVSPFQISYPPTWVVEEKLTLEEPKSLTVIFKNPDNETIEIIQGVGGGGRCVFYDDADYATYEGAGQPFSSYIQLTKPALWRLSQYKQKNKTSHTVCEKNKNGYIDGTRIGSITVNIKSKLTTSEIKTILEGIIFKPTPKTKTLFD